MWVQVPPYQLNLEILFFDFIFILYGDVAEWSIAAVLKTVVLQGTVGSNPTVSANLILSNPLIVTKKMKKMFFSLVAVATLAACSNSSETTTDVVACDTCAVDSTLVDTTVVAPVDSVVAE